MDTSCHQQGNAERHGIFRDYTLAAFARFFDHELDEPQQIASLIAELDGDGADYLKWAEAEGARLLDASIDARPPSERSSDR